MERKSLTFGTVEDNVLMDPLACWGKPLREFIILGYKRKELWGAGSSHVNRCKTNLEGEHHTCPTGLRWTSLGASVWVCGVQQVCPGTMSAQDCLAIKFVC